MEDEIASATTNTDNQRPKYTSTTREGIFLGYRMQPGGKWSGEYIVATMKSVKEIDFRTWKHRKTGAAMSTFLEIRTTRDCRLTSVENVDFPCVWSMKLARQTTIAGSLTNTFVWKRKDGTRRDKTENVFDLDR